MQWIPLLKTSNQKCFSKQLADKVSALNAEIDGINKEREAVSARSEKLKYADIATIDPLDLIEHVSMAGIKEAIVVLLQRELRARRLFDEVEDQCLQAFSKARDKAYEKVEATKAEIRKRLVSIGYVDAPVYEQVRGKIMPEFITRHPEVADAAVGESKWFHMAHDNARQKQNEQDSQFVEGILRSLLRGATTVAA